MVLTAPLGRCLGRCLGDCTARSRKLQQGHQWPDQNRAKMQRRSTDFSAISDRMPVRWGRRATPLVFFLSMCLPPLAPANCGLAWFHKILTVGRHATSRQVFVRKASEVLEPGAVESKRGCARCLASSQMRNRQAVLQPSLCSNGECHSSSRRSGASQFEKIAAVCRRPRSLLVMGMSPPFVWRASAAVDAGPLAASFESFASRSP